MVLTSYHPYDIIILTYNRMVIKEVRNMNNSIAIVLLVASVLFLGLVALCIRKEKDLVGFYSQIGVCGRWYAFITGDLLLVGIGAPIAGVVAGILKLRGVMEDMPIETLLAFPLAAVIALPLGLLLLRRAQKKCPEALRKHLVIDMVIMMVGTSFRLGLFFMAFIAHMWWKSNQPRYYEINGKTYYAYPGTERLYDDNGNEAGKLVDSDHAIMKR